jgi:hypothetical protein
MTVPSVRTRRRAWSSVASAVAAGVLMSAALASPAQATPPGIPTQTTAQAELNALVVAAEGSTSGYSRDLFPHWIAISGTCNTRETVLQRDGAGVSVNGSCQPTTGSWFSPYDGATWTDPADVDIDHIVPLAEAWRSGANTWTTTLRRSFANDLNGPQLIAVTDNVNQAKGDRDPSTWQPPRSSYRCTYAKMWINTKYRWGLRLQSTEKTALQSMLDTC